MTLSKTLEYDTGFSSIDHESTKENVDEHSPIVLEGLINRRNSNFWDLVLKNRNLLYEKWCYYSSQLIRSLLQKYLAGESWRRLWGTAILLSMGRIQTFPYAWSAMWKLVELVLETILAPANYFSLFWKKIALLQTV